MLVLFAAGASRAAQPKAENATKLAELIKAVESGKGYEFIEFKGINEQQIVLNRKNAEAGLERLLKTYRIARDRSDNLLAP